MFNLQNMNQVLEKKKRSQGLCESCQLLSAQFPKPKQKTERRMTIARQEFLNRSAANKEAVKRKKELLELMGLICAEHVLGRQTEASTAQLEIVKRELQMLTQQIEDYKASYPKKKRVIEEQDDQKIHCD